MQDRPASIFLISATGERNQVVAPGGEHLGRPRIVRADQDLVVHPDQVRRFLLAWRRDQHVEAVEAAGGRERRRRDHGLLVEQGAGGLEVEHPRRRPGDPRAPAERIQRRDEAFGPGLVGSGGKADHDLAGQDQYVAAVGKALAERQHALEAAAQSGGDRLGLADPARRAGPQHDRALGQDEGGILDEHGIGKGVERRQRLDRDARSLERRDIGLELGEHPVVARAGMIADAQAIDDARRRRPDDRRIEVEHPHNVHTSTLPTATAAASIINRPFFRSRRLTIR